MTESKTETFTESLTQTTTAARTKLPPFVISTMCSADPRHSHGPAKDGSTETATPTTMTSPTQADESIPDKVHSNWRPPSCRGGLGTHCMHEAEAHLPRRDAERLDPSVPLAQYYKQKFQEGKIV